jgi:hypothetical protein
MVRVNIPGPTQRSTITVNGKKIGETDMLLQPILMEAGTRATLLIIIVLVRVPSCIATGVHTQETGLMI